VSAPALDSLLHVHEPNATAPATSCVSIRLQLHEVVIFKVFALAPLSPFAYPNAIVFVSLPPDQPSVGCVGFYFFPISCLPPPSLPASRLMASVRNHYTGSLFL
jgi:hypothetical protein